MKFIADFHIHSHYSRATSKEMNIVALTKWAQIKGLNVMGTGDFTHPKWFKEMKETLEPAEKGLYKLSSKKEKEIQTEVPEICRTPMRFIPTVEIASIYKKNDKVRKIHSIIVAPSLEAAEKINKKLGTIGNIYSDGRPILGIDVKDLLKIALDTDPKCMMIPAHIWTPWFAIFGSMSGFDSLEECFDELAPEVFAVETGLSSDPAMNWRIPELDTCAIVSNSDAHSAEKLGREANIFNTELSYNAIYDALKKNDPKKFEATIEFYPEEGKYHLDGHRDCDVRLTPEETKKKKGICPKCHRPVTVGVMHRVDAVAQRKAGAKPKGARPFYSIIPLPEVIAEMYGCGVKTKRVSQTYHSLVNQLGNEFHILLNVPIKDIESAGGPMIAEAISRVRKGKVHIAPGFDGEFGTIKIFDDHERQSSGSQKKLF